MVEVERGGGLELLHTNPPTPPPPSTSHRPLTRPQARESRTAPYTGIPGGTCSGLLVTYGRPAAGDKPRHGACFEYAEDRCRCAESCRRAGEWSAVVGRPELGRSSAEAGPERSGAVQAGHLAEPSSVRARAQGW